MPTQSNNRTARRALFEWLFLIFLLIAVGGLIAYAHLAEANRINNGERDRLQVMANVVDNDIQGNLVTVNHGLEGVMRDFPAEQNAARPSDYLVLRLRALETVIPGIRAMFVLNADGKVLSTSKRDLVTRDLSFREYFKTARNHPDYEVLYISEPFQSLSPEKKIIITVCRAVKGKDGQFSGLVAAALDQEFFINSFRPIVYAPDVWGFVADSLGQKITNFPEMKEVADVDFSAPDTFFSRHLHSGGIESVLTGKAHPNGEQRLMVLRTLQPASLHMTKPIVIAVSRRVSAIEQSMGRQAIAYSLMFLTIALISCAGLYWIQSRRLRLAASELEVLQGRNELQTMFDNMKEGVLVFDNTRTIVRANPAARSILGLFDPALTLDEIWRNIDIFLPTGELVAPEDWPTRRGLRGDFVQALELEIRKKNSDESIFIEISVNPVYDESHNLELLIATYANVTDYRVTNSLRESEARFRTLIEDAPLAIAILRHGEFVYSNRRYNLLHGYSPQDSLRGMPWSAMISDASHKALAEQEEQIAADSPVEQMFEAEGRRKDGSVVPIFKFTTSVHLVDGDATLIFTQDISGQKRAELAMLQARDVAEAAHRSKAEFLANMSHEIRTPLNGVVGMIEVLHQSSLKGYQVEMVDLIRESAFSLLTIIDDILDFSKIEAGRLVIESAPMSLSSVVENACSMFDYVATKNNVELMMFVDPAIPATVLGDAVRFRQVLLNLISNAIKFSGGSNPGRVSVRAMLAESSEQQVIVNLNVTDNGIGMDEAAQSRLFKAFSQADSSTTRRFGGTGLGLVISGQLIDLMGGAISLHSVQGEGSTFAVRQTFGRAPAGSDEAINPVADVSALRCLVIGRAGGTANDISTYLLAGGSRVERAVDIEAAQSMMDNLVPGLWIWVVLCADITLPEQEADVLAAKLAAADAHLVAIRHGVGRITDHRHPNLVTLDGNVLTRRRLFGAVALAAGLIQEETESSAPDNQRQSELLPSRTGALRQGRLILVAEDNETNQKVIVRQLALLGFVCDVVSNGRQALECWYTGDYGLVLTDLHMPEMDGYELATRIRADQQHPHRRRTPIVALTANALAGEAGRCRAAGMDDFLSKPVQLASLKAMLEKWLPAIRSDQESASSPARPVVDVNILKGLIGTEPALIREVLRDFKTSSAEIAANLRSALEAGRSEQVNRAAHKLKSSARAIGAVVLGEICARIEKSCVDGDLTLAAEIMPQFEQEFRAVDDYLDSL